MRIKPGGLRKRISDIHVDQILIAQERHVRQRRTPAKGIPLYHLDACRQNERLNPTPIFKCTVPDTDNRHFHLFAIVIQRRQDRGDRQNPIGHNSTIRTNDSNAYLFATLALIVGGVRPERRLKPTRGKGNVLSHNKVVPHPPAVRTKPPGKVISLSVWYWPIVKRPPLENHHLRIRFAVDGTAVRVERHGAFGHFVVLNPTSILLRHGERVAHRGRGRDS